MCYTFKSRDLAILGCGSRNGDGMLCGVILLIACIIIACLGVWKGGGGGDCEGFD